MTELREAKSHKAELCKSEYCEIRLRETERAL